jgi:hypothetical protein
MAKDIAVTRLVAIIVELVKISFTPLHRLERFQAILGEIPRCFQDIKKELSGLRITLQLTRENLEAYSVKNGTKKALLAAIKDCAEQIGLLDPILAEVLPEPRLIRGENAILSLQQKAKIEKITETLRSYHGTLRFYNTSIDTTLEPVEGSTLSRAYITSLILC